MPRVITAVGQSGFDPVYLHFLDIQTVLFWEWNLGLQSTFLPRGEAWTGTWTLWQRSQWDCWSVLCQNLDSMIPVGPFQLSVFHYFMISISTLKEFDSMSQCQVFSICHLSKNTSTHGKGQGGYTEASPLKSHPSGPMEYIVIPRSICTKSFAWRQKWDKGQPGLLLQINQHNFKHI